MHMGSYFRPKYCFCSIIFESILGFFVVWKDKENLGGNLMEVSVRISSSPFRTGAPKSKGEVNREITTTET